MEVNKVNCEICEATLSKAYLERHVKLVHPNEFSYLRHLGHGNRLLKATNCKTCGKKFSNKSNLKRHIKEVHKLSEPEQNVYTGKASSVHVCDKCPRSFMNVSNLNAHRRTHRSSKILKSHKCAICDLCIDRKTLLIHYEYDHDLKMEEDEMCFESLKDFFAWKKTYENETKSLFIETYNRSKNGYTYKGFHCHKSSSGTCSRMSLGHEKPENEESIKSNYFCPASIKLKGVGMEYIVQVCKTHLGHPNKDEGSNLIKLEQTSATIKVSCDDILDEIRHLFSDSNFENSYLPTKNDFSHIEASFRSSSLRHSNDVISVESWINETKSKGDAVLYYKPQGYADEEWPNLNENDFVLIVMTPAQSEVLKKYGSAFVCVDGMHETNSHDIQFINLLVFNDIELEFPCSFLVSNRTDKEVLNIFFTYVKKQIGYEIQSNIFMSDMDPAFYDAWLETMAPPRSRLFCPWNVDQEWRKHLKSQIKSQEKQIEVYKRLRSLFEEKEQTVFDTMISEFYDDLSVDQETEEFADYFMTQFMSNTMLWSSCYRVGVGINTMNRHERMHRALDYTYSKSKKNKRFDKYIHAVLRLVRDEYLDHLTLMNEKKLNKKNLITNSRHCLSSDLEVNLVSWTSDGWNVPSKDKLDLYTIQEVKGYCNCQLQCRDCQTCLHQYICSCVDSSIRYNMCKHIHLVCRYLRSRLPGTSWVQGIPADKYAIIDSRRSCENGSQVQKCKSGKPPELDAVEKKRQEVVKRLTQLIRNVPGMKVQEVAVVEKCISSLRRDVRALKTFRTPLAGKK